MKRAIENRVKPRSLAVLAVSLTALAGCEEALTTEGEPKKIESGAAQNEETVELFPNFAENSRKAVEAPEVFQVSEAGLWDGRPSLGGVWVAHPDVSQPEQVVIKNPKNNKTVTGALFRRERDLPGPALQLSSAAAEKLGILAGSPTKLEVVALRRKPVEKKEPEEVTEVQTAAADDAPEIEAVATQSDTVEAAADDTQKPAKRKWWQKKETAVAAGAAGAAAAVAASDATSDAAEEVVEAAAQTTPTPSLEDPTVSAPAEKPAKRKWWQKKETAAAGTAGAAAADATAEATTEEVVEAAAATTPTPTLTDPTVTGPEDKPAKRKWWQKKPSNEITETPLDPIEGAAAAIEASEVAAVETAAATQATTPRSVKKPFVQVGTFTVEANAKSAAEKIKRNGLPADVQKLTNDGKTVWRVLVGPATTRAQRNAMQSDVKDLGFTDAYSVKN